MTTQAPGLIAITGATGFIGRRLTARLVEQGFEVLAVLRPGSPSEAPSGVTSVHVPLEASALVPVFRNVVAVVHLAGVITAARESEYDRVNVRATRAVAEAAQASGARLIHFSSLAAAGPAPMGSPRRESDPPEPMTPYGRSKLEGERVLSTVTGLQWTALRPAIVYGPGDRALLPLFQCAQRGIIPVISRPDAAYTFVHVDDVIRTVGAALASEPTFEPIFVGHPEPVTVPDLLAGVQAAVGRSARTVRIPRMLTWLAAAGGELAGRLSGRPMMLNRSRFLELSAEGFVCRVDRLSARLGIVAEMEVRRGLNETAQWYRHQGWL